MFIKPNNNNYVIIHKDRNYNNIKANNLLCVSQEDLFNYTIMYLKENNPNKHHSRFIYKGEKINYIAYDDRTIFSTSTMKFLHQFFGNRYETSHYIVNNKTKTMYLHHVIWISFNEDIPPDYEIDHHDSDITNNKLTNLNLLSKDEH